jgi:hypothetical protein
VAVAGRSGHRRNAVGVAPDLSWGAMKQMFRRREGTGGMYADNRRRPPRAVRRLPRKSSMMRGDNRQRPWLQEGEDISLDHIDLAQLVQAATTAAGQLLDLLEDVGRYLQRCRRWRQRIPGDVLKDMGDVLDWYLVLFTVGLVDRQGVWLAAGSQRPAPPRVR